MTCIAILLLDGSEVIARLAGVFFSAWTTVCTRKSCIEVVNAGTISAAAQNLHVSQPALSKTIKNLETELGQSLLKRTNHGVCPTVLV